MNAQLMLGIACARTGNREALELLPAVLEQQPDNLDALLAQTIALKEARRPSEAIPYAKRITELRPEDATALSSLGFLYVETWNIDKALDAFQRARELNPGLASAHLGIGIALQKQGFDRRAISAFRRASSLLPNNFDSSYHLAQSFLKIGDTKAAEMEAERALELKPTSPLAHLLLAEISLAQNKSEYAQTLIYRAIELGSEDPTVCCSAAYCLQMLGDFEKSRKLLELSLKIRPVQGTAYLALVQSQKITKDDRALAERMAEVLKDQAELTLNERALLEQAYAKALADLSEYERALQHYDKANVISKELKFGGKRFDRQAYAEEIDWRLRTFTATFANDHESAGLLDETPIFIVGMPRSGTTLLEQILSRHPCVGAGGEQTFWGRNSSAAFAGRTLRPDQLSVLANDYLREMKSICPDSVKITDKNPANHVHVGLIHMALPKAKFLHTRRHPVDTCLSNYMTPNSVTLEYAHDRDNIVFVYQQYQRIMDHWRLLVPSGQFLDVDYEELVRNQESTTRKVLDFLGLPWDDACLTPQNNGRVVATPSMWQVRQPVYSSSVERWRRYEPWLGAFAKLLPGSSEPAQPSGISVL